MKILYNMYYVCTYIKTQFIWVMVGPPCVTTNTVHIPKYYTLIRCILYLLATIYIDKRVLFTYTQKTRLILVRWLNGYIVTQASCVLDLYDKLILQVLIEWPGAVFAVIGRTAILYYHFIKTVIYDVKRNLIILYFHT